MVFFVCGGCGGSFKRKQADQHTFRCRNWAFSCMDCNKDFPGQSYVQHTQCITESEKYFGNHHVAKVGKDKNEVWMNKLRERLSAQAGLKPYIAGLVTKMLSYPNIPRKQSKFENFLKTSMNMSYKPTVDELWRLVFEAGQDSNKENSATNGVDSTAAPHQTGKEEEEKKDEEEEEEEEEEEQSDTDAKLKKKKKRKLEKNLEVESEETTESSGDAEPKKKKKRKSAEVDEASTEATCEQEEEESDESTVKESKSAKRRRRKQQQSATEEPDPLAPIRRGMGLDSEEQERDLADYEDITVDTVVGEKNFKWRRTLKKLIREGPSDGIKVAKLLSRIDQLHNDPLAGASQPLPKDTLQTILTKMLSRKPFCVVNGKATLGNSSKN